ncbi:hypothetical protein TSTA_010990 [Talaromyces stipitatus ATCC 10500]|uniref:Uncharacterized protein n=1 Tax=Talaromyces stipitatus (strain ATCC 10500 / CBS 375.48 / QM 6759 / NRRL 1006) TaxID=441959 RepID=B8MHK2_TALSN|nr:uncharacterized protein TSTA_010990 [Talaromyces stipitatus ATCC 10500]EED15983.1 hypothetical protein TSTA_010990 [Talaromyces stipitatus ATCC 10500]
MAKSPNEPNPVVASFVPTSKGSEASTKEPEEPRKPDIKGKQKAPNRRLTFDIPDDKDTKQEGIIDTVGDDIQKDEFIEFINENGPKAINKELKIPDRKKLSNGKDSRYESWKIDMLGKLHAQALQYNTPEARKMYVKSMCEGDAADHLMARMRDDTVNPFNDVD